MHDADFTWLQDYRISSRIATGGMAEVYLAWKFDRETGEQRERVAIKKLLPHLVKDRSIVQMFVNEAKIIAQIHHPNVVRILDLGNANGEWFIAMDLLEGRSFSDLRTRAAEMGKRVPLGITLRILTDACRGLDAAHRARGDDGRELRIVHRDFTPDNVHVGVDGKVKVIDFGIAKAANVGVGTEPGTLKGKFFYMSPEMIAGQAVDHRADLFAAGVMLYEQLCGRRPFTGNYSDEVLARIAEGRPRRPTEFDPSVPVELENICLKALQRDPNQRFPSLAEFIQAMEAVGGSASLARPTQVGGYVSELFPPEEDEKRKTLRQARLADPSLPGAKKDEHIAVEPDAEPPPPPFPLPPVGTPVPSRKVSAVAPAPPVPAPAKRGWLPFAIGGAALLLIGAGVAVVALKPSPAPEALLEQAKKASTAEARTKALAALGEDSRATEKELLRACELLDQVKANEALEELASTAGTRFPKNLEAALYEAKASTALRKSKRAESALERAKTISPEDPRPHLQLAELRELQGDLFGAIEALKDAREKGSEELQLLFKLGYLESQAGRLDDAEATLKDGLGRKFDPSAAAELAFVKFRQEQSGEALRLLKSALAKDRQLAKGYYYLGAVLYRQGDAAGAEKAYKDADRLAPSDSRALAALCELQSRRGDSSGAETTRSELQKRFPAEAAQLVERCKAH